jgi:predicted deacylase
LKDFDEQGLRELGEQVRAEGHQHGLKGVMDVLQKHGLIENCTACNKSKALAWLQIILNGTQSGKQ